MAITFLAAINKTLKRANVITTDITAFTGNTQQGDVDVMIQVWNEVIDELAAKGTWPTSVAEGSITLATDTKEYAAETDFVSIAEDTGEHHHHGRHGHHGFAPFSSGHGIHGGRHGETTAIMINESDGSVLIHYPGGWDQMRWDQLQPSQHVGKPVNWAMNKVTGKFELDTAPTATNNGDVYKYIYNKRTDLSGTTDTFPILDEAVDTLIPAVVQLWSRDRKKEFDQAQFAASMSRATKMIRQRPMRSHYGAQRR